MRRLRDLWMRDPYLVSLRDVEDAGAPGSGPLASKDALPAGLDAARKNGKLFWLYGTTDKPPDNVGNPYSEFPGIGFNCYCSEDLETWEGPFPAFRRPEGFWADTQFWAPEVYVYRGRLIMFATMKKSGKPNERGVVVLESPGARPEGPFVPITSGPTTPPSWSCLDGTLHVEDGVPYMVFCREWTQVGDGEMCAMRLSPALAQAAAAPFTLFSASQASWCKSFNSSSTSRQGNYITDGPFMHRCASTGELIMLWSSRGRNDNYCVGIARSSSGKLKGPWVHDASPLFQRDGGHAMLARVGLQRSTGSSSSAFAPSSHSLLIMALHSPNRQVRKSSPKLFGVIEERDQATGRAHFDWFEFL
ncbi:Xylosidase/arabinosidase [Hondaea fermentalgiana]|uniref:Endo-1,5-alpha-L-arabinanase A n=1 Tax=Hondaea fermentalgiana TaxID=2315210 RepID=A0A2R5GKS3_9STRA|nr:Xylosidase/arabinosidase [Hondaea fermentalgiana]|eukprot:GBG29223.1 Xylosidase/arabinosidase [Hondaea fermentalgiana]